jgi:hypothetical protein
VLVAAVLASPLWGQRRACPLWDIW